MRILFAPILGVMIPYLSGVIHYSNASLSLIIIGNVFFILTSFAIWKGCSWVHIKVRPEFITVSNPFLKILAIISMAILIGSCIGILSMMTWYKLSTEAFTWNSFLKFLIIVIIAVIVFTLIYEILYLSREREADSNLVKKMGDELTTAGLLALTNEIHPHFIFNSLNAMSYLILNSPQQAYSFNQNLAQVFKYFLLNKKKALVSLQDELNFLESYFFLLQIRYNNKVALQTTLSENYSKLMIPPCALQVLMENAIKHNLFSTEAPLRLNINMSGEYLKVSNKINLKTYAHNSTGIGLKNLSQRFKLICNKEIIIENSPTVFTVRLPLIQNAKKISHDKSNYY
jgi:sensor histidine kinase YesM